LVNREAIVDSKRRWFAIILAPTPSISESFPELEFIGRDYRPDQKFGLRAGLVYVRQGDETVRVVSGTQFEIARVKLGKAAGDANYYRTIDRLSRKVHVGPDALSVLVEGTQSIVRIEDEIAIFSSGPEQRRVVSTSEATSSHDAQDDAYLKQVEPLLWREADSLAYLAQIPACSPVTTGGRLGEVRDASVSPDEPLLGSTLHDSSNQVACVIAPAAFYRHQELFRNGNVVIVRGRVERTQEQTVLRVSEVRSPRLDDTPIPVVLNIEASRSNEEVIRKLKEVLRAHRGPSPVYLQIRDKRSTMVVRLAEEFWVDPRRGLYAELKGALGEAVLS
jgi:hypothetical protein